MFGVIIILAFPGYSIYKNSVRYFAYDVRTEIRNIEKATRYLPVVTLCAQSAFYEHFYCYKNDSFHSIYKCQQNQSKKTNMKYVDGKTLKEGNDLGNDCYVFNANGTTTVASGKQFQQILFKTSSRHYEALIVNFQSIEEFKRDKELTCITKLNLKEGGYLVLPKGVYNIYIAAKQTIRLPEPYTSSCVDGNLVSTRFSDGYTYDSCQESCAYDHMLRKCHDVVDAWTKYSTVKGTPSTDSNIATRKDCLAAVIDQVMLEVIPNCTCRSVCEETKYIGNDVTVVSSSASDRDWLLNLYMKGAAAEVKQVEDFPGEQFLGSVGGVIGLGGKFQVAFQLFVFICLLLGNFCSMRRR